ncbi:hypothetical protein [Psychromonas sp. 14N.309.X.WAT.B.A12]|uniref:hypothetical protein n=1 Tax=unclassified Psychromonas TaxID=2614957 RepID=UPI0025B226C3|nr:hypothetical protein [Psychromonas sp. 14N.309.X.WAT.B.A12]MDN2664479.1 hypothetical protein [Psychromonas sp. 14N.309.X.WAT.B.A12]
MTEIKDKSESDKKNTEEEKQAWLDSVHFGSCCSDPLPSDDESKQFKSCSTDTNKAKQDNN